MVVNNYIRNVRDIYSSRKQINMSCTVCNSSITIFQRIVNTILWTFNLIPIALMLNLTNQKYLFSVTID